jgi:hypothetical protein
MPALLAAIAAALFALFPLTDTDIWWHLAIAREWLVQGMLAADPLTWTPSRVPWVDIHEYFERIVYFVFNSGGAYLLIAFKAVLWGCVFYLFARTGNKRNTEKFSRSGKLCAVALSVTVLFVFRYTFEIRPVLFTLVFLGAYWNILPELTAQGTSLRKKLLSCIILSAIQWFWCRTQGLFILGPIFATLHFAFHFRGMPRKIKVEAALFIAFLFVLPLAHFQGKEIFLYPFPLLNRLLGATADASAFAGGIAENRSPFTLLLAKENLWQNGLLVILSIASLITATKNAVNGRIHADRRARAAWLGTCAVLALIAERNAALFLPPFIAILLNWQSARCRAESAAAGPARRLAVSQEMAHVHSAPEQKKLLPVFHSIVHFVCLALAAFALCFWVRSLTAYSTAVSRERVPVHAAEWCAGHPHSGRLFNDDRAGGYLSWKNPEEKTFIDGRFILRSPQFFERYLNYASAPETFIADADSMNIDRAVLPLRYYAKWGNLIPELLKTDRWHIVYRDEFYVVLDKR